MNIVVVYVMIMLASALVVVLAARWAMRRADDQDHMPRSAEVPATFAPRSDGA